MTKKSEERILEDDLGIDLPKEEQEVVCESLDEKDLTGGNNTRDPSRSIFDPTGKTKSSFVGTDKVEKGVEKNRYIGTLVQSSRTELKYNYKIESELEVGDRSIKITNMDRVEVGDKVRIEDDRGYKVKKFVESKDESNKEITFVTSIEEIKDEQGSTSDHISKNADIVFIRRRIPWIDKDENIRSSSLLKMIQRSVQTFVGENGTTEQNNGFNIQSTETHPDFDTHSNNFVISKGNNQSSNNLEQAGRYYIKGIPAMIYEDVLFEPKTESQFLSSRLVMPETTDVIDNPDFRDEGFIIDKNANFPVSDSGESLLDDRKVLLGYPNPVEYSIKKNTKTKLTVNTQNERNVQEVSSGKTYYRIRPSSPNTSGRIDSVYLNIFFKEVTQNDDSDLYVMNQGRRKTHSQNRLQIKQRVEVRQENDPELNYNGTDDQGRFHLITKIAEFDRSVEGIIGEKEIKDKRNVFRSLDKIGLQNILFNPSFELTDTNTGDESIFIDWGVNDGGFDVDIIQNTNDNYNHHQNQSAQVRINENFGGQVELVQDFEGQDLIDSVFRDQSLTFSMNAMPLSETGIDIVPFIREKSTNSGDQISEGQIHEGLPSFQRLTVTRDIRDTTIEKLELGFKIKGNGNQSLSVLFDAGSLVYGNFPSGVPYFENQALEELSVIRDEIRDARRSDARNKNFQDVDKRLDGYESEIITARNSDAYGQFNTLDSRNENIEGKLDKRHDLNQEFEHPAYGTFTGGTDFVKILDTGKLTHGINGTFSFNQNSTFSKDDITNDTNDFNLIEDNIRETTSEDDVNEQCMYLSPWGVQTVIVANLKAEASASGSDDEDKLGVHTFRMQDAKGYNWVNVDIQKRVEAGGFLAGLSRDLGDLLGEDGGEWLELVVTGPVGAVLIDHESMGGNYLWPQMNDGVHVGNFGTTHCIEETHPEDSTLSFDKNYNLPTDLEYHVGLQNQTGEAWYRIMVFFRQMRPLNLLVS